MWCSKYIPLACCTVPWMLQISKICISVQYLITLHYCVVCTCSWWCQRCWSFGGSCQQRQRHRTCRWCTPPTSVRCHIDQEEQSEGAQEICDCFIIKFKYFSLLEKRFLRFRNWISVHPSAITFPVSNTYAPSCRTEDALAGAQGSAFDLSVKCATAAMGLDLKGYHQLSFHGLLLLGTVNFIYIAPNQT